jgi:hypothetical protein
MADEVTLVPEDVRVIEFYGDVINGALVRIADEVRVYVPLRPLCEFLGLSWSGQRERTMRDEVLADVVRFVRVTRTNSAGGNPNVLCIPLEFLPGWLFGISTQRVKGEYREKIIRYRRECYQHLWKAFKFDILQSLAVAPPAVQPSGAVLAYELATAVQNLAREQMELEGRMRQAAQWAKGIESRVTALELRLQPDERISEAQAAELAAHVKTVAQALESKGTTNGYQRVYGELYRRYGIGTYRALPQDKLAEALAWLRGWYDELAG